MNEGDRQIVNGVECVRVGLLDPKVTDEPCEYCPHLRSKDDAKTCDTSCGARFVWIKLPAYVAMKLEE